MIEGTGKVASSGQGALVNRKDLVSMCCSLASSGYVRMGYMYAYEHMGHVWQGASMSEWQIGARLVPDWCQ
jgi:hypothetical protein